MRFKSNSEKKQKAKIPTHLSRVDPDKVKQVAAEERKKES